MDTPQVISTVQRKYILDLLKQGKRMDGRGFLDFREVRIDDDLIPKAEGSASVHLGDSFIITGIKYDVGTPFPDSPDEGVATCMAEFIPFASPMFESGPPDVEAVEVARVVDRGIRHGDCIEYKKLCIKAGELVYILFIDMYVMNHAGNLIDTGAISSMTALLTTKLPTAKIEDGKAVWNGGYMLVPINQIPLSVTFGRIQDYVFVDPVIDEELVLDGRVSFAVNEKGQICSMQKSGEITWTEEELIKYSKIAVEKVNELRNKLNLRQYVPKL
ncbi:MAG: exosome complex protein Rrp42 [Candidatus Lokiarchaeota archaeon]|nr:exosome complex protein Rrp42 [Candidatus Lokiarchaeota archaeon]